MAFSRSFKRDFNQDRGLDPRAMATLAAKKNSRAAREDDLRRKQIERELNSLRARLTVIDREIQRLNVFERRYNADEARANQDFAKESKSLLGLTEELGRHSSKVQQLKSLLESKKVVAHKSHVSNDFGREMAEKESDRVKAELKRVDGEIDQLNSRRRRLASELSSIQQKIQKAFELESREDTKEKESQNEINRILEELQSEESIMERFKSRFSSEQRVIHEKERQLSDIKKRIKGATSGAPALEVERERLQKKINDLEKELN